MARDVGRSTRFGWQLSTAELNKLRGRIEADPHLWTAQTPVALSTVPTLTSRGFEPRPSVLRAFAVARGATFVVMPGGLLRVAPDDQGAPISNEAGTLTKDVWVLATEPEQRESYWLQGGPTVAAVEPSASMPSRAAENLFWLGRYAERAEDVVRLLRVAYDRRNDFASGTNPEGVRCLSIMLRAVTEITTTYPGFTDDAAIAEPVVNCSHSLSTTSARARSRTRSASCSMPPTPCVISCPTTHGS